MAWTTSASIKGFDVGMTGWAYNRMNYQFDQELRWQRFTTGRKMVVQQFGMFRQDVTDLVSLPLTKLRVYAPMMAMMLGTIVQMFVQGRFSLSRPGPPTFMSALYLQSLGVAFAFMVLGMWLALHAALGAQVAAVQLRTRKVRIPVPTQRQLDTARKLLSGFEEQTVYDMIRLPFVMPNGAKSPHTSEDDEEDRHGHKGYTHGGLPGIAAKVKGGIMQRAKKMPSTTSVLMPGTTSGCPTWVAKEITAREELPKGSPSGHGTHGPQEPFEHFELVRQAQKAWWSAEAYTRVCFLFGMLHFIHAAAYWLLIHTFAEQGMVWCAILTSGTATAALFILFRLDVLPELGGSLPVEAAGPFVSAIALCLVYINTPSERSTDIARAIAVMVLAMHLLWTFRLYSVAKPSCSAPARLARESGGSLFNRSAACELPTWLPVAFQPVAYLVAPPKPQEQLETEKSKCEGRAMESNTMADVDMTPWFYTRTLLLVAFVGWAVLLGGRIVELMSGERMLVTNPGTPPWTRASQWKSWELGPVSSKAFAHVTPQRGHFAWAKGWGPQGQQQKWPSDRFGYTPEADAWWGEDLGAQPLAGAAGLGENTWAGNKMAYGQPEPTNPPPLKVPAKAAAVEKNTEKSTSSTDHTTADHSTAQAPASPAPHGGHRRLRGVSGPGFVRALVPAAVQWPALLEPEHLVCSPGGDRVIALNSAGLAATVPPDAAFGRAAGTATSFSLEGLYRLGMVAGVSWGSNATLLVTTRSGTVAACPALASAGRSRCEVLDVPRLPLAMLASSEEYGQPKHLQISTVVDASDDRPMSAAVAVANRQVLLLQLVSDAGGSPAWQLAARVVLPTPIETPAGGANPLQVASVTASHEHLLVATADGSAFRWQLRDGLPVAAPSHEVPAAGLRRNWHSACALPNGKILRLASTWRRSAGGAVVFKPELLL